MKTFTDGELDDLVSVARRESPGAPTSRPAASTDLAAHLKRWRGAEGVSQRAAATLAGVPAGTWANWEQGKIPGPAGVGKLAALLGSSSADIRQLAGADRVRRPETSGGVESSGLAGARLARGLSQATVAAAVGVHHSIISRWECAERRPAFEHLKPLSEVLCLSESALLALLGDAVDTRPRTRKLRGLGAALAAAGVDEEGLEAQLGMSQETARQILFGRLGVSSTLLPSINSLLGRDPLAPIAPLRSAPDPVVHPFARFRARFGMRQEDVGGLLGVSRSTIGNWERGRSRPTAYHVRMLAARFSVPPGRIAELFDDTWIPRDEVVARAETLPDALVGLRAAAGLSRAQTARIVGVQAASVARWETGQSRPLVRHMGRLAVALDVDPEVLGKLREQSCEARGRDA